MRKVVVLALVAAAGALAYACGDDDDDKGGGSGGPNKCEASDTPGADGCSDAQKKAYGECVQTACDDKYSECYGPGYKAGNYSGACGSYLKCTNACDCDDLDCYQACTPSSECNTCMLGFVSCASECQDKLACAFSGDSGINLGDSGVSFGDGSISFGDATFGNGKTCKDLLSCCNSLSAGSEKTECTMVHGQLVAIGSFGDIACGEAIADYCP